MNGFTLEHLPGTRTGPTIVLMSGMFAGDWMWDDQFRAFAEDGRPVARVVEAIAMRPEVSGTIPKVRAALEEACDAAGIQDMIVCGASMGAAVAMDMAVAVPERVRALVLTGTPGLSPDPNLGIKNDHPQGRTMFTADYGERLVSSLFHGGRAALTDEQYEKTKNIFECREGILGVSRGIKAMRRYDMRAALRQVRCPVLNLWGAHDLTTPVESWAEVAETHSNHRLVVIEDSGHVPMVERPERYTEIMRDFAAEFDLAYGPAAS
ncbi:alpha/beta hydrolase [Nonomuraea longispora]|uniref:Alpha/beta hydrolase n=1 Tax=Nonomuraea longispora TaxID=1848320 RepID=A0A4V2XJV2_9ACTN|nr:alpha/beta hydrolase [Nonomuraea longispora]TDC04036.1 alpha/beta hydrolase [Nonomuraea longispora]